MAKFTAIFSLGQLREALRDGHQVEYSASPDDTFGDPPAGDLDSNTGWIVAGVNQFPERAADYFPQQFGEKLRKRIE